MKYRNNQEVDLFDKEFTLQELSDMGNPLPALKEILDFEQFRSILESVFDNDNRKSNAGRKPIGPVFMMKVVFLQRLHGAGDQQIEYLMKDRISFRDFLGIDSVDDVPDEKTVWAFKNTLAQAGTFDTLFAKFNEYLEGLGLILNEGKIIDASFVIAPRQRNTREENKAIKDGKGDELWNDNKHKKCHKGIDARWTKKRGENYYGYKDHASVCQKAKIIHRYTVTAANRHDSKETDNLLVEPPQSAKGENAFMDAGYVGMEGVALAKNMTPVICEKGTKGHPLTDEQKESNRVKSKTRCRVEHVFGFMEQTMGGLIFRGVGIVRAKANIALTNLVYNMCRLVQIKKYHPEWIKA